MNGNSEFCTQDMKSVMDKIMKIMDEPVESQDLILNTRPSTGLERKNLTMSKESTKNSVSPSFEEIYSRMQAFQRKHDLEIKKMQEKSEEKHRILHTHTPKLNEKSRTLIGNISPLHSRYKLEASLKEKRRKDLITKFKSIKEEEIKKELTFTPKTSSGSYTNRTPEEFYKYNKQWKDTIEKIDEREREAKKEKDLEGVTFKPKLNKNSAVMTKNIPSFGTRVEKGIQIREAKINEKKSISPCSFRPELQTNYKKIELGPVFDRLYPKYIKIPNFSSNCSAEIIPNEKTS
jgi:hypothetical protein